MSTIKFTINKMHCTSCALNVEETVKELEGVQDFKVSFQDMAGELTYDTEKLNLQAVERVIADLGYEATLS